MKEMSDMVSKQFFTALLSLDKTHLAAVRGLSTKNFHPSASTRRAQPSVAAKTVRSRITYRE